MQLRGEQKEKVFEGKRIWLAFEAAIGACADAWGIQVHRVMSAKQNQPAVEPRFAAYSILRNDYRSSLYPAKLFRKSTTTIQHGSKRIRDLCMIDERTRKRYLEACTQYYLRLRKACSENGVGYGTDQ